MLTLTLLFTASTASYSGTPFVIILCVLSYRFGRKLCLILLTLSGLIGNILFYFSTNITGLILSLATQGILIASALTITIMVVSEYTSPKYRGIFVTFKTATMFWGIWVANAIGTFYHWKNIGIVLFVCSFCNLSSFFCYESPYWLATKGRYEECVKVHRWLKGTDEDSEAELKKLILSQQEHLNNEGEFIKPTGAKMHCIKLVTIIRNKGFYKPIGVSVLLLILYNVSGKMACTVYAIDIIKKVTLSEQMAYKGMLILDAITVVGMYFGCALTKIVTRRKQLLGFSFTGVAFLGILSIYLYVIKYNPTLDNNYVSLFLLTGYSLSISCGPMILVPGCTAELSPLKNRSVCLCLISFLNLILFATTLKIAPFIFIYFSTPGTFLFFALSSSVFIFILYKYLPETKDHTILEIEENMIRGDSRDRSTTGRETIPLNFPDVKQ